MDGDLLVYLFPVKEKIFILDIDSPVQMVKVFSIWYQILMLHDRNT